MKSFEVVIGHSSISLVIARAPENTAGDKRKKFKIENAL
jgi:hypothetical protein